MSALDLGVAGIRYYAGSVLKSRMFQLQQRSEADRYVHAAAFVAHQFFRSQDNLVDLLLSVMTSFQSTASRDHKERLLEGRKDQQQRLKAVVNDLDTEVFGLIREIRRLASADDMSDTQKVCAIRGALEGERTGSFERLKAGLDDAGQDRGWHDVLEAYSLRLQNRLNPILRVITFKPNERAVATRLIAAIDHFTASDGNVGARAPVDFLDPGERAALIRENGAFRPSLYKVFLFQHVTTGIKSGDLNITRSYKYRPMDTYLVDADRWKREKAQLLKRAWLSELADPASVLVKLDEALHAQYQTTNDRMPDNQHLKVRADGVSHVATPAIDATQVEPLGDLFLERHDIPLMHNDVVKSDIHSTDTHGYTEAVFGMTHLLGFSFAPRIKGISKQRLYLFRGHDRDEREDWKIAPAGYINDALIRENWDDMLRLVATIKLKENTASDIFRRLNSYSRQHALYQTLKAFGQIIKSLFILQYIDDLELRQSVEKQLNKVELANRFTRAVAVGNPREFTQAEKEEQEIAEACNRLIKNSIICWNYLYLARKIEKTDDAEAQKALLRMIATHSPITWAHINMLGEYDFADEKLRDAVGILPLKSAA